MKTYTFSHRRGLFYGALAVALVLATGTTVLLARHAMAAPAAAQPAPALTVSVATPRHATWPSTLEASGAIAPWQEASIGTQIGGYQLIDVRVNVGDEVKKGQLLARLDPALLRADLAQLQASYDQAQANRERALSLKASGAISDQDVLQFVTQAKTAAAQLASRQLQLRYTDVVAPDDGAISSRSATLGAVVPVGQELFRLIRQNRLEWRGELTAPQLIRIAAAQKIELTLPDGSRANAKVRQTAPSLDAQSRLGLVYADIEPGSHARAGMYASGRVVLDESAALVVPAQCVVIRDGRSYVVKLLDTTATPKVSLQAIETGRREAGDVEILRGLGDNDRVVAQGAGFLNDGDIVRVAQANTPAAAPVDASNRPRG